jgi:DNA-binding NarL/FixJ family response regulator
MTKREGIRVLIADDHFFTRMGVATALSLEKDIGVVAQAASGREAIELFEEHRPDVAVLDGQMPDMHGREVVRELSQRFDAARLILFSIEDTEEDIHSAVSAGASGYLSKGAPRAELVNAIRQVASGRRFFPERILHKLREREKRNTLSARELEVLRCMAQGLQNKEIAAALALSGETVKTYVTRILEKLNVQDRTQAVMAALQRGLLKTGSTES